MAILIFEAIQLFTDFVAVGVVVVGLGILALQEHNYRQLERRSNKRNRTKED